MPSRAFVVVAALCALVCATAHAEQELAVYPGAVHTRIGKDLNIGGEYFRLAYFLTADSPEQVAMYFGNKWKEEGIPFFVDASPDRTDLIISGVYTREGLMRSIVLRRHGEQTLGFTVLKDLWMKAPSGNRPGITQLEGSLYESDVSFEDEPGGGQHRGSLVERGWSQTYREVRARLEKEGFRLAREFGQKKEGKQQVVLEHARRGSQVVTVVTEVSESVTVVSQTAIGSDRPDLMPNDEAVRQRKAQAEAEAKRP